MRRAHVWMGAAVLLVTALWPVSTWAAAASSTAYQPNSDIEFEWRIVSVGSPYTTYRPWHFGDSSTCPVQSNGCTMTFSQTESYSNSVSGTANVWCQDISAAVGFDVTYSSSSTAQFSMALKPGQSGQINWRDTYSSKNVTQEEYYRYVSGGQWEPTGNYAYCTAHKWIGFNYEGVITN